MDTNMVGYFVKFHQKMQIYIEIGKVISMFPMSVVNVENRNTGGKKQSSTFVIEITEQVIALNPFITEQKRKEKPPVLPRPHAKCPAALSAVSWSCTCKPRVCFAQTSLASPCALSLLKNGNVMLGW